MQKLFRVFIWGMLVSFVGSLPLGTMNVTVTQLSAGGGVRTGFLFATGAMIVEVIIVRTVLVTVKWLVKQQRIFQLLEYVTTAIILFLAIASFIAAYKMTGFASPLTITSATAFWAGAFLSLTNPLHIPFWLGWTTVLMNKNILRPGAIDYNWYVTGIGLGTMIGFAVFIYAGNFLVAQIQQHQTLLNYGIGIVLAVTATIQVRRMTQVPSSARYNKLN